MRRRRYGKCMMGSLRGRRGNGKSRREFLMKRMRYVKYMRESLMRRRTAERSTKSIENLRGRGPLDQSHDSL